jgi:tetrahydromethanopterin S-methyltransferase subunit G
MGNMSYCRFENTVGDMQDCENALNEISGNIEELESEVEQMYAKEFIKICKRIASDYAD